MLNYQRVNLHFPMVFLWFSHFPWFSHRVRVVFPTVTTVPTSPRRCLAPGRWALRTEPRLRVEGSGAVQGTSGKMSGKLRGRWGKAVLGYWYIYIYILCIIYIYNIIYIYMYIYIQYIIWILYIYDIYGVRRVVDGWTSPSERNFLTFRSGPLSDCSSGFIFWSRGSCHRPCSRKLLMPLRRVCPELRLFCWDFWDLLYSVALGVDTLRLHRRVWKWSHVIDFTEVRNCAPFH